MSFASCTDLTTLESTLNTRINGLTVADATETVKGKVELATTIETAAGIDNTRAVTPFGLSYAIDESFASELTAAKITNLVEAGISADAGAQSEIANAISDEVATAIAGSTSSMALIQSALTVATETTSGKIELATADEVKAATDSQRAIVSSSLKTALADVATAGGNTMQKSVVTAVKAAISSDASAQSVIAAALVDDIANAIAADSAMIDIMAKVKLYSMGGVYIGRIFD